MPARHRGPAWADRDQMIAATTEYEEDLDALDSASLGSEMGLEVLESSPARDTAPRKPATIQRAPVAQVDRAAVS